MLSKLEGNGWTMVEPPLEQDGESVVARHNGEPIKAGFLTEIVRDNESEFHAKYRSGPFDLEIKIDFDIERGQVRVTRADGYDNQRARS
jgi:hypothetical protein